MYKYENGPIQIPNLKKMMVLQVFQMLNKNNDRFERIETRIILMNWAWRST